MTSPFSEFTPRPSSAELFRAQLKQLGINPDPHNFDEELFLEHAVRLEKQWNESSLEQRQLLSMDWYFDVVAPGVDKTETRHEAESAVVPLMREVLDLRAQQATSFNNRSLDENNGMYYRFPDAEVGLYGASRLYDVFPGGCVTTRLGKMDIIGTSELSQCQALIAKAGDRVSVSHVLYGEESLIPKIKEQMQKEIGGEARWIYVSPEAIVPDDASQDRQEAAQEMNDYYKKIAQTNGFEPHTYYRVDATYNPNNVGSSSVIVSQAGISVVGTRFDYRNPSWKGASDPKKWMRKMQTVETIE